MPEVTEREVTYAVEPGWSLPDLSTVVPEGGRLVADEHRLEATYFDTGLHTLARLGITLRRRTGGDDAGWHLKVPAGAVRTEVRSRARQRKPPAALSDRVQGVLAGEPLDEVAMITTNRRTHRIFDSAGELLAEIADDDVHGVATGAVARVEAWREIEVEAGPSGKEGHLARTEELLTEAGATRCGTTRKLTRVLGPQEGGHDDALSAYVVSQCEAILLGELGLRGEVDVDGVHDTRVAVRRLRSALRMFEPMLEGSTSDLDDELRWLAGLLSVVRDADVLRRHLDAEVDSLPVELVMGPVRQELAQAIGAVRKDAVGRWVLARDGERYRKVLGTVADWHREPPVAEVKDKRLRKEGEKILRRATRKARKRLAGAGHDAEALHRARKALKRLRYTATLLVPVSAKAAKTAKRAKKLQKVLGRHQDLVVQATFLRRQGAMFGGREGHNGFAYGMLLARAENRAAEIREGKPRW